MRDRISIKRGDKTVVLIHGFPEPIYKDTPLYRYFDNLGYSIIAPYLFSPKFKLTQTDVTEYVKKELEGRTPDVIVGVSLGGLLAPAVAREYPNARLVLVGTGPYIKIKTGGMNELIKIGKTPVFDIVYDLIEHVPTPLYALLYKMFNHPKMTPEEKLKLNEHIVKNWTSVRRVSENEDREVIDFLTSVNNTLLLKSLKNKTLIFAADNDSMMPPNLSRKMNHLIKHSRLVIGTGRIHYTVFDETDYKELGKFLLD
jgi:pimeloyl-ACP methyl ester carboxylesterase